MGIDKRMLEKAIDLSKLSLDKGAFPAGAVVARGDDIISESISAKYPKIHLHAESQALDFAIEKLNRQLSDCTLYASMEPCLMCLTRAYWVGVKRIVYAIEKKKVSDSSFEGNYRVEIINQKLNEPINLICSNTFEAEALKVVKIWEERMYG